ncbi:MAG TPA: CDP-diacylglycerol--glycerol-3-phosphate 3-phosphatidyltransferase [Thermoanaerobacterales bacterium]|nr:CDP-diacylglycerol--glycerol-3-phosphate 3-phosphatidyltransferase [Thermoanaerobacterales bacterium]
MNLPNKISLLRVLLVPLFLFLVLGNTKYGIYLSTAVFIIAACTDGIDGHIARTTNQVTKLGKFLDPLADKFLITAAIIALVQLNKIPGWIAFVIISRDLMVDVLRMLAASEGVVIHASYLGKFKTTVQIIAVVSLLLDNYPFHLINFPFSYVTLYIALILTVASGLDYLNKSLVFIKN